MRVHGIATVVQPPEVKETKSGHTMLKLRLMDRNSRKRTQFWDALVWGEKRVADYVSQGIAKGHAVYIDGEIRQDEWGEEGAKKTNYEINLNELVLLASSGEREAPEIAPVEATAVAVPVPVPAPVVSDDPFS